MNQKLNNSSTFYIKPPALLKTTPQCDGENQSKYYCSNIRCSQLNSFICEHKQCICRQQHKMCPKRDIINTLSLIESKLSGTKHINKHIYDTIQKLICQLNKFTDFLLNQISQNIKFAGLTYVQRQFLKLFNNYFNAHNVQTQQEGVKLNFLKSKQPLQTIKKTILYRVHDQANKKSTKVVDLFQSIGNQITKLSQTTQSYMTHIHDMTKSFTQKIVQNLNFSEKPQILQYHISQNSNVLSQRKLIEKIFCKYFDKKPSKSTILYRASQFGFNISRFYDICQKIPNLMIVCSTNNGKTILGGFSSCAFQPTGKVDYLGQQMVKDSGDKNSFLFHLSPESQRDCRKFRIQKGKDCIRRSQNKSTIQFGYNQFVIKNQANSVSDCIFDISGVNYYLPKDYQSLNELNGFKVSEWEAWKIEWKQDKEQKRIIKTVIQSKVSQQQQRKLNIVYKKRFSLPPIEVQHEQLKQEIFNSEPQDISIDF